MRDVNLMRRGVSPDLRDVCLGGVRFRHWAVSRLCYWPRFDDFSFWAPCVNSIFMGYLFGVQYVTTFSNVGRTRSTGGSLAVPI